MFENIKSQDFKNEISRILNKEVSEITETDLQSVESVSLSKEKLTGKTDFVISDLQYLKGIKHCSFSGFNLTDQDILMINSLSQLEVLEMDFCDFELVFQSINNLKLEEIYIDKCNKFNFSHVESSRLKIISILGFRDSKQFLDMKELIFLNELEELEIHYCEVNNVASIKKVLPNLKILNLDGSNVNEKSELNDLQGVEVSNESFFLLH